MIGRRCPSSSRKNEWDQDEGLGFHSGGRWRYVADEQREGRSRAECDLTVAVQPYQREVIGHAFQLAV